MFWIVWVAALVPINIVDQTEEHSIRQGNFDAFTRLLRFESWSEARSKFKTEDLIYGCLTNVAGYLWLSAPVIYLILQATM